MGLWLIIMYYYIPADRDVRKGPQAKHINILNYPELSNLVKANTKRKKNIFVVLVAKDSASHQHWRKKKVKLKMKIEVHHINEVKIAEITSVETMISTTEDGVNLLGNLYYQGFDRIVLHEKNISPDFFDLKNGIAGEILQKFSTYRVRLAIVGDFSKYTSKSLTDFMYESNKGRQINFVNATTEALKILSN